MTVALVLFLAVAGATGLIVLYTVITGLTPVPTSRRVRSAILAALPARTEGTIVELGSGWGALALALALRYPACRVIGYELSPLPWLVSRVRGKLSGVPNLVLCREDFYRVSLAQVTLAVCYLFPGGMEKLKGKLEAELGPGALVVSNTHPVPGWEPTAIRQVNDQYGTRVYIYRIPAARGDGTGDHRRCLKRAPAAQPR